MKKPREQPQADHRIQFHFTPVEMQRIDYIQQRLELPSYIAAVRVALKQLETSLNKKDA